MSASSPVIPPGPPTAGVDFDRVAGWYDGAARLVFGSAQHDAQRAALAGLPAGTPQLLVLGGGSGWVLGEVWRRRPAATVLYLEASAGMLRQAEALVRQQWPAHLAQVEFRLGTEAALTTNEQFDAVLTFFVFDCMEPTGLELAVARLAACLRPGGAWLVAEFTPPRRWWQRTLQGAMYAFFRVAAGLQARRLADYEAALAAWGWHPQRASHFFGSTILGAVFSDSAQVSLKK
ncbi:class I SAM-dependent methyltransferase [Hymenobacter sp. ASUV-10]|uniref:Class I SAM-dependent methyltransferase n=1 Tax=Hymenobacter aranciens TaxID=3063996 RepID=A0ABT9BI19_9BACT|nr:class I SAM-dependent methyltransferase [Hymenobacter sp. ASUV-10]MDO7876281.1 class I SAM-dependent methyltransferase [Hymenobacter sp. ASUV-10]